MIMFREESNEPIYVNVPLSLRSNCKYKEESDELHLYLKEMSMFLKDKTPDDEYFSVPIRFKMNELRAQRSISTKGRYYDLEQLLCDFSIDAPRSKWYDTWELFKYVSITFMPDII